jgi:hypothetical protein
MQVFLNTITIVPRFTAATEYSNNTKGYSDLGLPQIELYNSSILHYKDF